MQPFSPRPTKRQRRMAALKPIRENTGRVRVSRVGPNGNGIGVAHNVTEKNANVTALNVQTFVQQFKTQASTASIANLQSQGRWGNDFFSYVTTRTKKNEYKSYPRFVQTMNRYPKYWDKSFFFEQYIEQTELLKDAFIFARQMVVYQTRRYIRTANITDRWRGRSSTGWLQSNIRMYINYEQMTSSSQLDNLGADDVLSIMNTAHYASRSEAIAYYYHQSTLKGIMYYAAQRTQAKYKRLGVRFVYTASQYVGEAYHPRYPVPTITIGNRRIVKPVLREPGRRSIEERPLSLTGLAPRGQGPRARRLAARRARIKSKRTI
jgi:hypothetical protein